MITGDNVDKRRHERLKHSTQVDFSDGNIFISGEIRDISLGGMQIESLKGLPKGAEIVVVLSMGSTAKIKGTVRWVRKQGVKHFMGIQFHDITPELESAIREIIQALFWQAAKA